MVNTTDNSLWLASQDGIHRLPLHDIIYLEARSNYTCFHFAHSSPLLAAKTLKDCAKHLPATAFQRVHHSYVVNKAHIQRIAAGLIHLTNGNTVQISRRRKKAVLNTLAA